MRFPLIGETRNYLCPPIHLVGDTIKHAKACNAKGILIVPLWVSASYYPLLWDGRTFRSFIKKFIVINPRYYSNAINSVFNGYANFKSLALQIDFS